MKHVSLSILTTFSPPIPLIFSALLAPSATAKQSQKRQKHAQALYTEAWVEFLDKKMAKVVAEMLNAQVIGGKKGDRWRDDVWTMKYLSGFRWEMLGEQIG